ncbi:MAG: homocysteine biosynthesis protein [Candidatus Omnitrophica bacterium]|nr:homocysteine biosynthesis protein [Candidatus Omnitrophota bacterium]
MKTIEEINEKVKKGQAVVVTAEEMLEIVRKKGEAKAAKEVDVVTTGTFGPMCSSSIYLNFGHPAPRIKIGGGTCFLNGVPAYTGLAAVDVYLGATAIPPNDPRNLNYPGEFSYGGGYVIEELVNGKHVLLEATSYGTDCYPRKELRSYFSLKNINEAILFNPRNCYQNYNVAVNSSDRMLYTYMGILKPNFGNANFCSAGILSPLLRDPEYYSTGIGTRIFLGGGVGYVAWHGTQHNPSVERTPEGVPKRPAGTLAVIGDLKQMSGEFLRGASFVGYGVTLIVGIGIPIPVIDEKVAFWCGIPPEKMFAPVVDYSRSYPERKSDILREVSYAELFSGTIKLGEKKIPAGALSSFVMARKIAEILKNWISSGKFELTNPVARLPGKEAGVKMKGFEIKEEIQ